MKPTSFYLTCFSLAWGIVHNYPQRPPGQDDYRPAEGEAKVDGSSTSPNQPRLVDPLSVGTNVAQDPSDSPSGSLENTSLQLGEVSKNVAITSSTIEDGKEKESWSIRSNLSYQLAGNQTNTTCTGHDCEPRKYEISIEGNVPNSLKESKIVEDVMQLVKESFNARSKENITQTISVKLPQEQSPQSAGHGALADSQNLTLNPTLASSGGYYAPTNSRVNELRSPAGVNYPGTSEKSTESQSSVTSGAQRVPSNSSTRPIVIVPNYSSVNRTHAVQEANGSANLSGAQIQPGPGRDRVLQDFPVMLLPKNKTIGEKLAPERVSSSNSSSKPELINLKEVPVRNNTIFSGLNSKSNSTTAVLPSSPCSNKTPDSISASNPQIPTDGSSSRSPHSIHIVDIGKISSSAPNSSTSVNEGAVSSLAPNNSTSIDGTIASSVPTNSTSMDGGNGSSLGYNDSTTFNGTGSASVPDGSTSPRGGTVSSPASNNSASIDETISPSVLNRSSSVDVRAGFASLPQNSTTIHGSVTSIPPNDQSNNSSRSHLSVPLPSPPLLPAAPSPTLSSAPGSLAAPLTPPPVTAASIPSPVNKTENAQIILPDHTELKNSAGQPGARIIPARLMLSLLLLGSVSIFESI